MIQIYSINPMTRAALKSMSDEDKRKYKEIGQENVWSYEL